MSNFNAILLPKKHGSLTSWLANLFEWFYFFTREMGSGKNTTHYHAPVPLSSFDY